MIVKIVFEKQDGQQYIVTDLETIKAIAIGLPIPLKCSKSILKETLRNKYFVLVTELHKNVNTGYTKVDLHTNLKPLIFQKFADFNHYFTTGVPEYSTQHLTVEGWQAVLDQLRSVALDTFNYTFSQ